MTESSKRRISRVHRREREEDMKQRKRGIRRMFAGAMAALMMLSVVDVSGWGVMNAKAEENADITFREKAAQNLNVVDGPTNAV